MTIRFKCKPTRWFGTIFFILSCYQSAFSRVVNAYENEIKLVAISIKNIEALIASHQTPIATRAALIKKLNGMKIKEAEIHAYFLKTANALAQLKAIDPILFDSVDQVKDKKGNITDVYVKIVAEEASLIPNSSESTMAGYSLVAPSNEDADISSTKYGMHTAYVEVKDLPHKSVWYSNFFLLAHEFGHLIYEVPNLAEYSKFHRATYSRTAQLLGHHWNDPSGKTAEKVLTSFLRLYRNYKNVQHHLEPSLVAKSL